MTFGPFELLIILSIVLLLIGPRRITTLGRSLGRSIHDFKLEFEKKKSIEDKQPTIEDPDKESR